MIAYTYGLLVFGLALLAVLVIGVKFEPWVADMGVAVVLLIAAWAAYYSHFQQLFVGKWGVVSLTVPEGQRHRNATWKDDNLWIETYDPETTVCIVTEYSKGNIL